MDSVEDVKREIFLDLSEKQAKKKQQERIKHLDNVIDDYESGK